MKNVCLSCPVVVVMIGCSGGNNDSEPECGANSSCAPPQLSPAERILGLWDRSGVLNAQQDILFTFIGADGEYTVYDFEQDDFGSGENCHSIDTGTIYRFSESSNYTIEFRTTETDAEGVSVSTATLFLQGENLSVSFPESGIEETWTPVIELATDDLELCE